MIYLDNNATTPHDPSVIEAMRPFLEGHYGNPSSGHAFGRESREAVSRARDQVARVLNCPPAEIIFTSGGTEANNFALKGVALARRHTGARDHTRARRGHTRQGHPSVATTILVGPGQVANDLADPAHPKIASTFTISVTC